MEARVLLTNMTCQVLGATFANNTVFNSYDDIASITDAQIDTAIDLCLRVFERVNPAIANFKDIDIVRIP